ncbi:hypothetical protein [Microbacterium telephonicum]|uniref:Uncharacterized protein n=1 Tax=Microbacterium telephonicum TaxID=1714841 RepID=A0A498CAN9_9MICO|nr:hypothetical protein [Microbacterium telephonicum]RLK52259.1 hypothetical protein C7474_0191 [Microbacterium telephonicum]
MDPLWASIAEFWWVAPAAAGLGAAGLIGVHHRRTAARRIEVDTARLELRGAQSDAVAARSAARIARADLARVQAERAASRASGDDVAAARRELTTAQRDAKAAAASVRSRRARLTAARAALPHTSDPARLPLARLMAEHDAVTAAWMQYETDPAKLIAFPEMPDARVPVTAVFLSARAAASQARPRDAKARITPAEYAAYRDAVHRLTLAFKDAEASAWREARASGAVPPQPQAWVSVTQTAVLRSGEVLARVAEETIAALRQPRGDRDQDARGSQARRTPGTAPTAGPASAPHADRIPDAAPPASGGNPVWPVPSRETRRPDA